MHLVEVDEAGLLATRYTDKGVVLNQVKSGFSLKGAGKQVLDAFLPAGYPKSVTSDYTEYQVYDSLQAFSSSIAGLLSSRAVLQGIGVGDSDASPTSALLLSVLQDSVGRIATILFAHRLGTALEPECKMYRLAADIFNDAAMILDCLSPALPTSYRVAILSLSSTLRSLCGVAAGSAKASLSAHFATQGNLGELNAKDSSQETVISLLGLLVGTVVVSHVSSLWATWTMLLFLLGVHLGTNYLAVRAVTMRTLNRQRANLVFSTYLDSLARSTASRSFPSPNEVSSLERILERDGVLRWKDGKVLGFCEIGVPLRRILAAQGTKRDVPKLLEQLEEDGYIVCLDKTSRTYLVALGSSASTLTQLHAWMTVLCMASGTQRLAIGELKEGLEAAGWDTQTGALETRSGTRLMVDEENKKNE